jgi:hypothetical protein
MRLTERFRKLKQRLHTKLLEKLPQREAALAMLMAMGIMNAEHNLIFKKIYTTTNQV